MRIPNYLKHKSVIVAEDYDQIDGPNAGDSDAKGLSLGLAQWNERGNVDISAKVWRHTGEKWSRQSEELPLHRVLDLALLILEAKKYLDRSSQDRGVPPAAESSIGQIALQNGSMLIAVNTDNPMISEDLGLFRDCWQRESEVINERIERLANLLKDMNIEH